MAAGDPPIFMHTLGNPELETVIRRLGEELGA